MLGSLAKGNGDLFVEVYTPQGATVWKKRFGGKKLDSGWDIAFNPIQKDIYVIGQTNSGSGDIGYHTSEFKNGDTTWLANE